MSSNKRKPGSPSPQADKKKLSHVHLQNRAKWKAGTSLGHTPDIVIAEEIDGTPTGTLRNTKDASHATSHSGKDKLRKAGKTFKRSKSSKSKGEYSKAGSSKKATKDHDHEQEHELPALIIPELTKPEPPVIQESEPDAIADDTTREKAATKIQAVYRGHTERKRYLQKLKNVIKVEALARGFLARKHVSQMRKEGIESDKDPTEK